MFIIILFLAKKRNFVYYIIIDILINDLNYLFLNDKIKEIYLLKTYILLLLC